MKMIRQGDVVLRAVTVPLPCGLKPKTEVILAEGELTGHAHRLTGEQLYEWVGGDGNRYIMACGGVGVISHEDHDPVPVPVLEPDTAYQVIPQQEYSLEGQWRRVTD